MSHYPSTLLPLVPIYASPEIADNISPGERDGTNIAVEDDEEEINQLRRQISVLSHASTLSHRNINEQPDLESGGKAKAHFLEEPLKEARQKNRLIGSKETKVASSPQRQILKNLNGLVKPGEMVLVLGRPGSGCSTFLKIMANSTSEYSKISGDISYGGMSAKEFKSLFPSETVYSAPADTHLASLTVQQTLEFAVNLKASGARLPGQSVHEYRDEVVAALLKIFNLSHVKNTLVGNEQIRGISGGQRKRVSIAEMMVSGATVSCWDNSTLGLDAVSATDYVRSLRILTRVYESTTFVSLYQASDTIYESFDKVLLLEDGYQIYFGPALGAQKYFEDLGFTRSKGQSVPDFLTASVDQRRVSKSTNIQPTTESLASLFQKSSIFSEEKTKIDNWLEKSDSETLRFDSQQIPASWRNLWGLNQSHYSAPFWQQVILNFRRHAFLKLQDHFSLTVQTATSLIVALLCGSIYFQLPQTSSGAFTRGGVIFITLLYNAFTAFVELPTTMFGRPVLMKHKSFGFHCPSALYFGQILFDIPMAAAQILLFSIIVYFMAGLQTTAQGFFIFYAFLIIAQAVMTVSFRIIGICSKTFDGAMRFACIIVILMVLTSGYLVPIQDMSDWVSWFYWINPISYVFSSIMMSEFRGLHLQCNFPNLVPSGPSYQDIAYQICTLPGSVSGQSTVDGVEYLKKSFSYDCRNLGRNGGIVVSFFVGLLILNTLVGEWVSFTVSAASMKTFLRTKKRDGETLDSKSSPETEHAFSSSEDIPKVAHHLLWNSIDYSVSTGRGELQLLHNISGYVESGCLMALMGASGAGKSTLLDVLCSRKTTGVIKGDIAANGQPIGNWFRTQAGYCEQIDVQEPTQTVREALRFSAYLRQPYTVPQDEKERYVEEVIKLLEMEDFSDALIGNTQHGLSVEERKKLSIGVELAAKPEILLFLDEPTSGLDSQSALDILRLLRRLANSGQAIVCTIHQPNGAIFELFDRLLLLAEGKMIFFGPTTELERYFADRGALCPPHINIAEFMLRVLAEDGDPAQAAVKWNNYWIESGHCSKMHQQIRILQTSNQASRDPPKEGSKPLDLAMRLRLVSHRASISLWRTPEYGNTRLFNHIAVGLLTGLAYLNIGNAASDLQYRVFVIFQLTVLPSMILPQVQARFELFRALFNREKNSNMYPKEVFLLSVFIAEIPQILLCSLAFFICLYLPTGFSRIAEKAGFQFLMVVLVEMFSVLLGQAVATLTPSAYIASLFTPFLLVTFSLFCGVTVPPPSIPIFWRVWLYRLNPFTYLVGGMMETELSGLRVQCQPREFQYFALPGNQTCMEYAGAFLETATGYFENPNSTRSCAYCPYKGGDAFIEQFGLSAANRWRDLGIFAAFCGSTFVIYFIAGSRFNWLRR
ncbi:ATP-binding cassette transporter [Bisporella sp. PMI_857]|nr:ATP-binding cassette transporter [Bisporella sp. PMI_857]